MDQYLRDWREDAARKSQHETAIFVADKVLALTSSAEDAKRLAQLHFEHANYARAHTILAKHELIDDDLECKYLAAQCFVKLNRYEEVLGILGNSTPASVLDITRRSHRKLASGSDVHTRHASTKEAKTTSRTQVNGIKHAREEDHPRDVIRWESGMSYLRGFCHAKLNAFDTAKACYTDAVRIDVHCFEAFDALMKNSLMSPDEEWDFIESLDFESASSILPNTSKDPDARAQAADFLKTLYTTRLSKHKNPEKFNNAVETLATHYNLPHNADILLSRAELLFTQCRFRSALALTTQILEQDSSALDPLPIHVACLHELAEKNALFLLAHDVSARHPDDARAWLAVATYYLTIGKIAEARRFFSKSSMMDPHFGPAWIGFAHTFAAEGEHDQAISAYSTAARLFQGTHLPQLFLGMQSLQNANMGLAREFLGVALGLCNTDPLVLNEMGVVLYHENHMERAIAHFNAALQIAEEIGAESAAYTATRVNLGHAYRRADRFEEALQCFDEVLRSGQGQRDAGIFSAKALCLLELAGQEEVRSGFVDQGNERTMEAIGVLHEALAVSPLDQIANELLLKALEESSLQTLPVRGGVVEEEEEDPEQEDFDAMLERRKREAGRGGGGGGGGGGWGKGGGRGWGRVGSSQ